MINFSALITPGVSIGGIRIGDKVETWLTYAYQQGIDVKYNEYSNEYTQYILNPGVIAFVGKNSSHTIENVCCNEEYQGRTESGVYSGMTLNQVKRKEKNLNLLFGYLVLGTDWNIGFSLPNEYYECDEVDEVPNDLFLNQLYVKRSRWWHYT